jgi:hypothetical protein
MAPTLCKKVPGCVHPPNHQGPCEQNGESPFGGPLPHDVRRRPVGLEIGRAEIGRAVSFLDEHQETARLIGRAADELCVIVGANTAIFEGGITRDGLDVLVHAKCGWSANRKEIPLSTVKIVLDALERVKEYVREPEPAPREEPRGSRKK